jgi:hypothetical protein
VSEREEEATSVFVLFVGRKKKKANKKAKKVQPFFSFSP